MECWSRSLHWNRAQTMKQGLGARDKCSMNASIARSMFSNRWSLIIDNIDYVTGIGNQPPEKNKLEQCLLVTLASSVIFRPQDPHENLLIRRCGIS